MHRADSPLAVLAGPRCASRPGRRSCITLGLTSRPGSLLQSEVTYTGPFMPNTTDPSTLALQTMATEAKFLPLGLYSGAKPETLRVRLQQLRCIAHRTRRSGAARQNEGASPRAVSLNARISRERRLGGEATNVHVLRTHHGHPPFGVVRWSSQ